MGVKPGFSPVERLNQPTMDATNHINWLIHSFVVTQFLASITLVSFTTRGDNVRGIKKLPSIAEGEAESGGVVPAAPLLAICVQLAIWTLWPYAQGLSRALARSHAHAHARTRSYVYSHTRYNCAIVSTIVIARHSIIGWWDAGMRMKYTSFFVSYSVCFRVHSKRQQAQSINISKHHSKPTSINLNTTIHTLM